MHREGAGPEGSEAPRSAEHGGRRTRVGAGGALAGPPPAPGRAAGAEPAVPGPQAGRGGGKGRAEGGGGGQRKGFVCPVPPPTSVSIPPAAPHGPSPPEGPDPTPSPPRNRSKSQASFTLKKKKSQFYSRKTKHAPIATPPSPHAGQTWLRSEKFRTFPLSRRPQCSQPGTETPLLGTVPPQEPPLLRVQQQP